MYTSMLAYLIVVLFGATQDQTDSASTGKY